MDPSEFINLYEYIQGCLRPVDESEFVVVSRFVKSAYDNLKQDGIMCLNSVIDKNELEPGTDYIVLSNFTLIRKNKPFEVAWYKNGIIQFDTSSEPLYRRLLPPPCETVNHVYIISKIIAMTIGNTPKNYLEYGVRGGDSSEPISKLVQTVYAVDMVDYAPKNSNIKFYKMLTDTFSETHLKDIHFDYAFIDADHSHAQVLVDFKHIYKYINKGGYIFLHDTYPCMESMLNPNACNNCYLSPMKIKELYPTVEIITLPLHPGISIIHKIE